MSGGPEDSYRYPQGFGAPQPEVPSWPGAAQPGPYGGAAPGSDHPPTVANPFDAPPPLGQPTAVSPFGGVPGLGGSGAGTVGRPPLVWLAAGFVVAVLGVAVGLVLGLSDPVPYAFAAWAAAGPIAVGLLAVHAFRDTQQRALPVYAPPLWIRYLYGAVIVLAAVGIVISSIEIALWAGRYL